MSFPALVADQRVTVKLPKTSRVHGRHGRWFGSTPKPQKFEEEDLTGHRRNSFVAGQRGECLGVHRLRWHSGDHLIQIHPKVWLLGMTSVSWNSPRPFLPHMGTPKQGWKRSICTSICLDFVAMSTEEGWSLEEFYRMIWGGEGHVDHRGFHESFPDPWHPEISTISRVFPHLWNYAFLGKSTREWFAEPVNVVFLLGLFFKKRKQLWIFDWLSIFDMVQFKSTLQTCNPY